MENEPGKDESGYSLVSIVMLAFNQKHLVEESIRSLLAQDYPNCELVVSDDNSTDGTFEAMQAAVADYEGPIAVRLNRTTANRGILSHFYEAVGLSKGRFIVAAGGDDISLPHRVSTLVEAWQRTGADAVFSSCTVIDEDGNTLSDGAIWLDRTTQSYFPGRRAYKIAGALASYDRRVFDTVALPDEPVWCEDIFFSLMIHYAGGRIETVPERLVLYRNHKKSLTNSHGGNLSAEAGEVKAGRLYRDFAATLQRFQTLVENDVRRGEARSEVDLSAVRRMRRYYELSANWIGMSFVERLRQAVTLRSAQQIRWIAPRLFGLPMFVRLKALQRSIRRPR